MRPISLKFNGINSFSEQTYIDFKSLTQSGIFGIFGDTGSGKSTILDCINFALYGRVERSKDKLDIINYRSDEAYVEFAFDIGDCGKRKLYTVERRLKKKSGAHKAMLYEDGLCVADNHTTVTKKITEVLGVDAEDFRKCIALPQGEFAQFVRSAPSDRISLIERLFSLEKYGDRLKEKIKSREEEINSEVTAFEAKLSFYEDVSAEALKELDTKLDEAAKIKKALEAKAEEADKNLKSAVELNEKIKEERALAERIKTADGERGAIEELRKSLKLIPLCEAALIAAADLDKKREEKFAREREFKEADEKLSADASGYSKLKAEYEGANFEEEIAKLVALSAKYAAVFANVEKLGSYDKKIENKRSEYSAKAQGKKNLTAQSERAEREVNELNNRLLGYAKTDLNHLLSVEMKGAILREEYIAELNYLVGLYGQVDFYKDDSELYAFMYRELKQRIEIYKDRVQQVKDFKLDNVTARIKAVQETGDEREKISSELERKRGELKDIAASLKVCESELAKLREEGENLAKLRAETEAELAAVFGKDCKDYAAAVEANDKALQKLRALKAEREKELSAAENKLNLQSIVKAKAESALNAADGELKAAGERAAAALEKTGFEKADDCRRLVEEFKKYDNAEEKISGFDADYALLTKKRDELIKAIGGGYADENEVQTIALQKRQADEDLQKQDNFIAVCRSEKLRAETRLNEKQLLLKDYGVVKGRQKVLMQLKELTRGNKFMEFIANEYLYDISTAASSTLLTLTDGRYFLTYTDTFYVGDNFNCGNLRGVNTLSGGETFLVSLSLALSLSQTICTRSMRSIEFFFLDEGFGTLDSALVDTVMGALEKLKSSSFTIGVISHVEELKHRIENKITVIKATESHGSTIKY